MNRLLTITVSMVFGLIAAAAAAGLAIGGAAVSAGQSGYQVRKWVERPRARRHPDRPAVAWLGDSTTVGTHAAPAYPRIIERRLNSSTPIDTLNFSRIGLNAYLYYMMLGPVLEQDPAAIFIVANPRMMLPEGAGRGILQVASMIPPSELPRAMTLPWHARSVTIPRLLLARAISWPVVAQSLYFLEGVRAKFRDALTTVPPKMAYEDAVRVMSNALGAYDTPISQRSPTLRMLAATVDMSVRHGVPTTVVVTPMPIAALRRNGLYGPRFLDRVDAMRSAVESAGGTLVDLHSVVPSEEFVDNAGHYGKDGISRLATMLAPIVRKQVERSTRPDPSSK